MFIRLAEFREDFSEPVHYVYDPKKLDLEFVDLKYLKKLSLDGTIEKTKETLVFQGHLVSDVEHICGRCLASVQDHVDQPFKLFYEIKGKEVLDTTDDLREILILNHPMNFICAENCRGLCPQCGTDLNQNSCDCAKKDKGAHPVESPFKKMWEKMKEEGKNG
ncbi:MAG: DUF177 domain-containing protein [Candidatus Omnitrophica bacterium]|nr:DUF177 domain-containing protein [Candidatus Omnitrophota bacterium]MDD5670651.1 DUF177 domain-containing protein [Candidatus Omnitrophota bacterium]